MGARRWLELTPPQRHRDRNVGITAAWHRDIPTPVSGIAANGVGRGGMATALIAWNSGSTAHLLTHDSVKLASAA